jgi:uncharacterized Rmd1/YagE family protein
MDDELIEQRFELVDDRFEHLDARLTTLETARSNEAADEKHAEGMRLNWIVVALFALELLIGGWQLWWVMRHA